MLSVIMCHNAEFRISFIVMLNVIMLGVIMLSVVLLNVIMLSVVMLNVVAPLFQVDYQVRFHLASNNGSVEDHTPSNSKVLGSSPVTTAA
jgi:hypothetical protein